MDQKSWGSSKPSCILIEQSVSKSTRFTILSATFLLALILLIMPSQFAHAAESIVDGAKYTYTADQGITITNIQSANTSVKVPSQIDGVSVVKIDAKDGALGNITSLDVSGNDSLTELYCTNNKLTSLNASNCGALKKLNCGDNKISSLNLLNLYALEHLWCANNELSSLNITHLRSLWFLMCKDNNIKYASDLIQWGNLPGHFANDLTQKASNATTGKWVHGSRGWWYRYNDGTHARYLTMIGNKTYFFDGDGWMRTGWVGLHPNYYYFMSSGAMKTGWLKSGGKWYHLASNGVMDTGWVKDGSTWYYCNKSGAMKTGWVKDGGNWYYCAKSGAMKTGWQKVSGKWYYLNPSDGKMLTGKQTIGGKNYLLNNSGVMKTGWNQEGSKWYYYDKSGAMKANAWISGKYWVGSDGVMAAYSWVDNGRYYVDGNGKWVKNPVYQSGNVSHCMTGRNHSLVKTGMNGKYTHLKCSVCGWEAEFAMGSSR